MGDIKDQPFWKKLNGSIKGNVTTLITRSRTVKFYKSAQIKGSVIGVQAFFIYYFLMVGNYSFHNVFKSFQFYICVLSVGGYWVLLEKIMEPLKKEIQKLKETIKTKMIVKICYCNGYCECREELNNYLKAEKDISII